jgi:hypothetical protein
VNCLTAAGILSRQMMPDRWAGSAGDARNATSGPLLTLKQGDEIMIRFNLIGS